MLPAASQYEKWEATFFNFEFPAQHLPPAPPAARAAARARCPSPRSGRASSAALGVVDDAELAPLREAAAARAAQAYAAGVRRGDDGEPDALAGCAPYVLYETLGPTLPDGLAGAAALWGLAHRCAMTYPDAVRRAGPRGRRRAVRRDPRRAARASPSRVDEYEDDFERIVPSRQADRARAARAARRAARRSTTDPALDHATSCPIVLSVGRAPLLHRQRHLPRPGLAQARRRRRAAGQRRGRDAARPGRRRPRPRDHGAAAAPRRPSRSATRCSRVTPRCRTASGSTTPDEDGETIVPGVAPNSLTSSDWRDAFAGTPWHKHVPARIEPVGG